jgi:aminoglycoside phosphotransferase (APT) family kinase protein
MSGQRPRLHANEVPISTELVGRLLAEQFPDWAQLSLRPVESTGTVNAIYRLGDELGVRLPLQESGDHHLKRELEWLPKLAPRLPLDLPELVASGRSSVDYPFSWAVFRWIEGQPYTDDLIDDEHLAATALGDFVLRLRHALPLEAAPPTGRLPLADLDRLTRKAIRESNGVIDVEAAMNAWDHALTAPSWSRTPTWVHTDLLRPNLLVEAGTLRAVIDFGNIGVGDPAADVIAAWSVFNAPGRRQFRSVLNVDDATWDRSRGYALHQAVLIIPYYAKTNAGFVATAKRTVEQVLEELSDQRAP